MESSCVPKLQIWEDRLGDRPPTPPVADATNSLPIAVSDQEYADRLAASEILRPLSRKRPELSAEKYSLAWYQQVEQKRYSRHGEWIPKLLEFGKHVGENLLGLGEGLGTDWVRFAAHGMQVTAMPLMPELLPLVKRNFELRGLPAHFLTPRLPRLPLAEGVMDVVYLTLPSGGAAEFDWPLWTAEIYRILKPGGKLLALLPAKHDVDYWQRLLFPWQTWFGLTPKAPRQARRYTASMLQKQFDRFTEHRIHQRHLRRSDVPHVWRWLPLPILERWMGRFLLLKTFKPVTAALPQSIAA